MRTIGAMTAVGVLAVLYVTLASCFKPAPAPAAMATGEMAALKVTDHGNPAPDATFFDDKGKPVKLSDFKGQVVVLNLWATWCPPCVKELSTLAKLQTTLGAAPVKVLTVSVDKPDADNLVTKKIASLPPLVAYRDPKYQLAFTLNPQPPGFPTTVIFDKKGIEVARMEKDADWSSPEARKFIASVAARP